MFRPNVVKDFISFLKHGGILEKFIRNLNFKDNVVTWVYLLKYPSQLINYGFVWSRTKEGHDFWQQIHDRWSQIAYDSYTSVFLVDDIVHKEFGEYML